MQTKYVAPNSVQKIKNTTNYPEFSPLKDSGSEEMVMRSLIYFIEQANVPLESVIKVDAIRFLPYSHVLKEWYSERYKAKGMLCVNQDEMEEGIYQIREKNTNIIHNWPIYPGEMLLIEDGENIQQRFKTFSVGDKGYLDLLTFSY